MINKLLNTNIIKFAVLSAIVLFTFALTSCEDPVPTDYEPQNFIEAILIVDEPITDIIVMKTQPVTQKFDYAASLIRDAEVKITGDGKTFDLIIDAQGEKGYYSADNTYLVKPNTKYDLEVKLKDGSVITGTTTTPGRVAWVTPTKDTIQYPIDTLKYPDRERIAWTKVEDVNFYSIAVICKDTLNYGKYLNPPSNEMNRRVYNPWAEDERYYEISSWAFIANTETSVVWNVFKWFGIHDVYVYAPDWNFLQWMVQHFTSGTYNDLLSTVKGDGIGVFGSASRVKAEFFLKKNQP